MRTSGSSISSILISIKPQGAAYALNGFSFSGQFVKLLSVYLQSRIHRRDLQLFPTKDPTASRTSSSVTVTGFLRKNCSGHILYLWIPPDETASYVFSFICKKIHQPGPLAQCNRQSTPSAAGSRVRYGRSFSCGESHAALAITSWR